MHEPPDAGAAAFAELFGNSAYAVLMCRPGQLVRGNRAAVAVLGLAAEEATAGGADLRAVFGAAVNDFWALVGTGSGRSCLDCSGGTGATFEAVAWPAGAGDPGCTVVVLRDMTTERRYAVGLRRLNALARDLVAARSADVLLAGIAEAAKDLTRADFAVLRLLCDGTLADVASAGAPVERRPPPALLTAPVLVGDEVVGELAVANRVGRPGFDEVDEAMLTELAAHAAAAVSSSAAPQAGEEPDADAQDLLDAALHEIRTPLTVAKGFLAMLRNHAGDLSPADREHVFDAIARAHERIQRLAEGALLDDPPPGDPPPPPSGSRRS